MFSQSYSMPSWFPLSLSLSKMKENDDLIQETCWGHRQLWFYCSTLWLRVFSKSPDEVNATVSLLQKGFGSRFFFCDAGKATSPPVLSTYSSETGNLCLNWPESCLGTNHKLSWWWRGKQLMVQPLLIEVGKKQLLFIFHCCLKRWELKKEISDDWGCVYIDFLPIHISLSTKKYLTQKCGIKGKVSEDRRKVSFAEQFSNFQDSSMRKEAFLRRL